MRKALLPVCRRIRLQHGLHGLCWGLMAQMIWMLLLMIFSFFIPFEKRNIWIISGFAFPVSGVLLGLLWPVSWLEAAEKADQNGLKERAQTAWLLRDRQDDMARLQREDAIRHLQGMGKIPLRISQKPLIAAGVCLAAAAVLFFVPNPQGAALRQRADLRQRLEKPAEALEKAADRLEETVLDRQTVQELRKLLGDLARQTRQARDSREALTAVSQAQQRMDRLLSDARNAAAEALGQAGLDALAEALQAGDLTALEQAMQNADPNSLSQAAQSAGSAALQAAAQALSNGNAAQAAQALGQLSGLGAASAALQSAKSAALGGQGQGKGGGSGAGQGSTNEDAGVGSGGKSGAAGSREGRYHLGEYEQIYDPTRLGDGGEITQSTGKVDENAQISELTLSPGLGTLDGSVPYDQVIGEYQAAAVQRAQEAALPGYAQQWVADYFSALTE